MFITRAINKDLLANIVQSTFLQLGSFTSSSLLDSLKFLGFSYATSAGISINIEDLKTPEEKKQFLKFAEVEIENVSKSWQQGQVSDIERFQTIIETWNRTTEGLKNRITEYYDAFDPANNLYIMAFSGARGNMSQVRQLVGMRGLMSDQEGRIIDLPIQTNFREGLTSIDYIISSYGARKGIVDTALKTADSGYLTRRLIYVAQDIIIREIDCQTTEGILILLNSTSSIKGIIGRTINTIRSFSTKQSFSKYSGFSFEEKFRKELKSFFPLELNLRSSLTCHANGSVCQKCYGWDLSHSKLISLGEAVGIIAAQSIGEPGTQLTMRTFHTGGIFTGEMVKEIQSPASGKVIFPKYFKPHFVRTYLGKTAIKVDQEIRLIILDWKNQTTEVRIPRGSYLYLFPFDFVRKNQKLADYSVQNLKSGKVIRKPVFTPLSGEIFFENLVIQKKVLNDNSFKYTIQDGTLWIGSGKIFSIPKEIDYFFPKILKKNRPFGQLKIVIPVRGIVQFSDNIIRILTKTKVFEFELEDLLDTYVNSCLKFSSFVKNNQYIESYTIIGCVEFFPLYEGQIYSVKKKSSSFSDAFIFITKDDIWTINSDQVNNYAFYKEKKHKTYIRPSTPFNSNSKFSRTGIFLQKDGFQMTFQNAVCLFFPKGTILKYNQGNFVLEKTILAKLKSYVQQTEDIVQGLPKIEELIEARKPKFKAFLIERPGILLNHLRSEINFDDICLENNNFEPSNLFVNFSFQRVVNSNSLQLKQVKQDDNSSEDIIEEKPKKRREKKTVSFFQSLFCKEEIAIWNKKLFRIIPLSIFPFELQKREKKGDFYFSDPVDNIVDIDEEESNSEEDALNFSKTNKKKIFFDKVNLLKKDFNQIIWKVLKTEKKFQHLKVNIPKEYLENSEKDMILETEYLIGKENKKLILFCEYLNPIIEYSIPKEVQLLESAGKFFDIGEPFTDGLIDVHDLLNLLFQYHSIFDGIVKGVTRSRIKFQLILVNSIQAIYQSQGVNISTKHIEIIVRQMMTKVLIRHGGDTPMLPGEKVSLSLILEISKILKDNDLKMYFRIPKYEPILMSATASSLEKDGFLSAAGFQETKRVLTKAALEGSCDWLRGLKECIILGRLIPAGSAFLNYKNYLDKIYSFKELK